MTIARANFDAYTQAIAVLKRGGLVILPTETVYGLAALASSDTAVRAVYAAKGRDTLKPLSLGIWSKSMFTRIAKTTPLTNRLRSEFWPGALTLVCPVQPNANISRFCHTGGQSIGIRHPDTPWQAAFAKLGFFEPIVLTSANLSGRAAPVTAQEAKAQIGSKVDMIISGGHSKLATASTVLKIQNERALVLRAGGLDPKRLAAYPLDFNGDCKT